MAEVNEGELVDEGVLPPDDFHQNIERIREVAEYDIELPDDLFERLVKAAEHLLVDRETLFSAATALITGNLILQGPPGTGKSSLARALCRAFNCLVLPVTAHENWSTFEVIGRQELRVSNEGEEIVPVNGFFTEAVIRCAGAVVKHFDEPGEPQAEWLLIDELNRAHLDKAFGELFTVLGTDDLVSITLPHQPIGNRELVTPKRFRIIATLNSVDRQFVNSLGQGLKRRFTFITLDVPPPMKSGEAWGEDKAESSLASREFSVVLQRAAERIAKRLALGDEDRYQEYYRDFLELLQTRARTAIEGLFNFVAGVRYAAAESKTPHLPIGTAQMIDVVELFLTKAHAQKSGEGDFPTLMDWAASIKLAPLFDADTINAADLEEFVKRLPQPFDNLTGREIKKIVAAGLYFVE